MRSYPRVTFNEDKSLPPKESILGGYLQALHFEDKIILFAMVTWGEEGSSVHRYVRVFGHQCSVITDVPGGLRSVQVFPIERESSKRDAEDEVGELLRKNGLRGISVSIMPWDAEPDVLRAIGTHPSKVVPLRPKYQAPYASPDGTTIHYPPGTYPGNGHIS